MLGVGGVRLLAENEDLEPVGDLGQTKSLGAIVAPRETGVRGAIVAQAVTRGRAETAARVVTAAQAVPSAPFAIYRKALSRPRCVSSSTPA